jgi:predicted ATPase
MEKLIVRNFGPIKEAEIDLTKYVVFIGDTSTGKSVLAKLIAVFRDSFLKLSINDKVTINFKEELKKYNIDFNSKKSEIFYLDGKVELLKLINGQITLVDEKTKIKNHKQYKEVIDNFSKNIFTKMLDFDKETFLNESLNRTLNNMLSVYVPAERVLFSMIGNSISGLWANNVALPDCYKDFAAKYEVARKNINHFDYKDFNLSYNYNKGIDEIVINNSKILLNEASSGIQSLVPLLLVLNHDLEKSKGEYKKTIIIEEPELNLYPEKQKVLISNIIENISDKNRKLIITTHSPYILSVLDTLILAKNTFNEHPETKDKINKIIRKNRWIDYNDISVYEVKNDGKIYSIKNKEFKCIDSNAIDRVSDNISNEFDKLTTIRYAQ